MIWKELMARPDANFRLKNHDPRYTGRFKEKEDAQKRLQKGLEQLCELQNKLYAQDRYSVLLVFQAMDAAGKDSTIKHVMTGVDPVVLGTPLASWSVPTFGPKVVTLHHRNPLITDADERVRAAATFFAPGTPAQERRRIAEVYGVTHVLASTPPSRSLERFLAAHATEHPLPGRSVLFALEE